MFFFLLAVVHAAVIHVDSDLHSALVNDTMEPNIYQLNAKLYAETQATDIGLLNVTLFGVSEESTGLNLAACTPSAYLFRVTTGYLAVNQVTFMYVCAHTIVIITDASGTLNFTNVAVNQSSTLSYFASRVFDIAGHGLFTNFTVNELKLSSTANALIGGSPVELFFNVCIFSNLNFNTSANASLVYSNLDIGTKTYYFNNTEFSGFTKSGNGSGGLLHFNSSVSSSSYTFERCNFKNFELATTTRGGILYANGKGSLNFTLVDVGNVTGGTNGSVVYSGIEDNYFSRSDFHNSSKYSFGLIWVQIGTLAIVSTKFNNLSATYTAGAICMGSAMTVLLSNFSNLNSSNPPNTNNSNTGIYMGSSTGLLTLSHVSFQNLTGVCNVCIYTACTMIGTNLQFLDSTALGNGMVTGSIGITPGSPVAWYTKAASTMTNCLCHNLTANYYSACCKFYGTSTWNSCIFRYIKGTRNGGMCCQDGAIIADNCTFLNLSTPGGDGGAIHWHACSDTLIRCLMYNCSCSGSGGGMLFGSTYFLANCEFANNSARGRGNDVHIDYSNSPEPQDSPRPLTPSADSLYGCCSTSATPRFTIQTSNISYDEFFPNCTSEIRYVNTTDREGRDTVSCGTQQYPCASLVHTANIFVKDIPLSLNIDYGTYVETGCINVTNRPVKVEGFNPATETRRTALRADDASPHNLFNITTGTLTCTHIYFQQARWTSSVISVVGNGSMTIRDCVFQQTSTRIVQVLLSSVVLIDNPSALCNFEQCLFHDLEMEDNSVVWIKDAKRVSFDQCQFTNISSTQVENNKTQVGGAISSFAQKFVMSNSSFVQCATARNGGAIYFGPQAGLSLTNVTFDRCTALSGSGGALYLGIAKSDAGSRYLARCLFLNNIAGNTNGNDIRDETGSVESWVGANMVECCSISAFRKFSVGNDAISFEKFLDQCFNNPCLNHSALDCPLECDNSSGVDCISGNCTRLHLETVCPATCRMYHDNCIPDRCYKHYGNESYQCELDSECKWDYPASYTDSSRAPIIQPGTKMCEAQSKCTREVGETNCTMDPCVLDRTGGCVPDKCRVEASTPSDCPQDCDPVSLSNNSIICQANRCTRQGREVICRADDGCVLEDTGTCTKDPCYGLTDCTAECTLTNGRCHAHECTRLHNEAECANGCTDNGEDYCILINGGGGDNNTGNNTDNGTSERSMDGKKKSKNPLSKGAVAGIVIGAVVGLAILVAVAILMFLWRRKKTEQEEYKPLDE